MDAPAGTPARSPARGRLFRKYLLLILSLVSGALLASGALSLYFSYQENKSALAALQQEKAVAAAARIEQYVHQIEQQLAFASLPQLDAAELEVRRVEFLKLLRQAPEVTDVALIDPDGRERIVVSRLGMDAIGSARDRSQEPAFRNAKRGRTWYSPVYFRKETEPYMTISIRARDGGPVTVADVNLKFIWDVVSRIRVGDKGKAYVVDASGYLVADPDIGLVLRKTDLSQLPHVSAALGGAVAVEPAIESVDLAGKPVLAAVAPITTLGWEVFVEQPVAEVYAKLNASILRTALLLLAGLVISALGALALARGMARPIRTLQEGAQRIGGGHLDHTIVVRTGDELEALAGQFNRMTAQLRESYAGLERKVDERTVALTIALEQQTAISEILRVISASPTDVQPVLEVVAERAARLCGAPYARVMMIEGDQLHSAADFAVDPTRRSEANAVPLKRTSVTGRAAIERRTVHFADVREVVDTEFPDARENVARLDMRAVLAVPLMREDNAYGGIFVYRCEPGLFSPDQVQLVETFARQAAIAIDNVRLFNETKDALERQTAISEILRVISGSPTEVHPVLAAVAQRAMRLCDADEAPILLAEDGMLRSVVLGSPGAGSADEETYPIERALVAGRAFVDRAPVHVPDLLAPGAEREFPEGSRYAREMGFRTVVAVPLMREAEPVGVMTLRRRAMRPFDDRTIGLLQTFADQAAIAVQNVRLFREIQDKSRQLEIANKHKSEFLANMSHELRTPLNAIIGFSEVLLERMFGELNDKQDEYLRDIHSSGRHLLQLINDILDLSKVEAGRMELEASRFRVPEAIDNAMTLIRERAQRHGIALGKDVDPAVDDIVADERKFKQILLNLLSNAVKFTPDGGRVDVIARHTPDALEVAVRDTGIGIAAEDQKLVFEEFRQVGSDYTKKQEGTGLGLALARRFVGLHGGTIAVESEPGRGSTFTFTIPWREMPGAALPEEAS